MRTVFHAWVGVALVLVAAPAAAGKPLARLSLDDAAGLGTVIATDRAEKVEGAASVRITTAWPVTVNLGEVAAPDVEGATLVYQARVKSTDLAGNAYLEMWVHFGTTAFFSRGLRSMVHGTNGWTALETPFYLKSGQRPTKVTLNLVINGAGTVWVDDVRLLVRPLPAAE